MINWDKELEKIFADPLLADVKAPQKKVTSSDRLIAGFQQIVDFAESHGRLPQKSDDREERALYNQLAGIRKDPKKVERCKPYDTAGILDETDNHVVSEPMSVYESVPKTEEQQLTDIFNDPLFADVGEDDNGLFDLPDYMQQKLQERREADYIAQRVKCEDFDRYESGFKEVAEIGQIPLGKVQRSTCKDRALFRGRRDIGLYSRNEPDREKPSWAEKHPDTLHLRKRYGVGHLYADALQKPLPHRLYRPRCFRN